MSTSTVTETPLFSPILLDFCLLLSQIAQMDYMHGGMDADCRATFGLVLGRQVEDQRDEMLWDGDEKGNF